MPAGTTKFAYSAGFVLLTLSAVVPWCNAQTTTDKAPPLRFEVASIRLAPSPAEIAASMAGGKAPHVGTKIDGNIVDMGAASLLSLICDAYSIPWADRVTGPEWLANQRFDVLAKLPAGATNEQLPELLQSLLAERFGLTFHRANKIEPSLALLVGPKGSKLEPAIDPEPAPDTKPTRADFGGFVGKLGPSKWGMMRGTTVNGISHVEFYGITMNQLADYLKGQLVRPVVDMTGLDGRYHVVLEHSLSEVSPADAQATSTWIFPVLEKLGLKLESRKVPVEQFVVDHIGKQPTEN